MNAKNTDNRPVKTIRLGAVEASIWENTSADGRKSHSVTFKRSYKDGEEWRDSDSYWPDHLPLLAKAADMAHTAILTELRNPGPASDEA